MIKNSKLIYGVGRNDYNGKITQNKKHQKFYSLWISMLGRCYSPCMLKRNYTYKKCKVCDEWLSLSNFKEWFDKHYIEGWELDKDLLSDSDKIYSARTCTFLPHIINLFLTNKQINQGKLPMGVYYDKRKRKFVSQMTFFGKHKFIGHYNNPEEAYINYQKERESYAKILAERYKDKLELRAYNALINYKEKA